LTIVSLNAIIILKDNKFFTKEYTMNKEKIIERIEENRIIIDGSEKNNDYA